VANGRATLRDSYPLASIAGQLPSGSTHGCYWGLNRDRIIVHKRTLTRVWMHHINWACIAHGPYQPCHMRPVPTSPSPLSGAVSSISVAHRGPWGSLARGSWWSVSRGLTLQGIPEGYVLFGPYSRTWRWKDFPKNRSLSDQGRPLDRSSSETIHPTSHFLPPSLGASRNKGFWYWVVS